MKKLWVTLSIVLFAISLLGFWGCGGDDDPVIPPEGQCSISVSSPSAGSQFRPGDPDHESVSIRWAKTGSATTVTIELLKGGAVVGAIDSGTANDGFYSWTARNLGAANGTDFSIRITAVGTQGCQDSSGLFSLTNTVGCSVVFTNEFPDEIEAGEILDLTWDSEFTTEKVDIQLMKGEFSEVVGFIAEGLDDDGSYEWNVDSLHSGTSSAYYLRIWDSTLEMSCFSDSTTFRIIDPDICTIRVDNPGSGAVYNVGDQINITLVASPEVETANLKLYMGNERLGEIKMGLDMTNPHFLWTVTNFGNTEATDRYNVRVFNADDQYCKGQSRNFTINVP